MGKRRKVMVQKMRHYGPDNGAHVDRYAAKRPRPVKKAEPPRAVERDLDAESEAILASLPGGTFTERMESARRGLFQSQDAIQSSKETQQ